MKALEGDDFSEDVAYFVREYLEDIYPTLDDIKEAIDDIPPKKQNNKKNPNSYQKILKFSYSHLIEFVPTNKVSGIPSSQNFLENLLGITINNQIPIHHSHITGNIIGYSHSYCNWKVRENQYKIPVVSHNLFKFDFFFFLKGLRAAVWGTKDIGIGGRNATDINFANTGNQIMFLDTIKYFQQSLGALANSLTESEKNAI